MRYTATHENHALGSRGCLVPRRASSALLHQREGMSRWVTLALYSRYPGRWVERYVSSFVSRQMIRASMGAKRTSHHHDPSAKGMPRNTSSPPLYRGWRTSA